MTEFEFVLVELEIATRGRQTTDWEPLPALESDQLSSQQSASRPDYLVMSFDPATAITNFTIPRIPISFRLIQFLT